MFFDLRSLMSLRIPRTRIVQDLDEKHWKGIRGTAKGKRIGQHTFAQELEPDWILEEEDVIETGAVHFGYRIWGTHI